MESEAISPAGLPSHAEARAIMSYARRLRAEAFARLARAAWARVARPPADGPAGTPAGRLPHAHA
jgi:hypothetical protein